MKRILIYKKINADLECNINSHFSNSEIFEKFNSYYKNNAMPNTGNKVWFQAIVNEVSNGNQISFLSDNMNADYINANFDLVVYPMANIFGKQYKKALADIGTFFKKITIPTFIISCGIQIDSENQIDELCLAIGEESKLFIDSIYNTGGQFALRGYSTNEFFCKLGYSNAAVVGCPSLYQKGNNLKISNNKVEKQYFKSVLNGQLADYNSKIFKNNNCTFIDQDTYVNPLFNKSFCSDIIQNKSKIIDAIKYFGINQLLLLYSGNIQLFFETNMWYNHLIKNNYSFSFGSRIHGNIMSILSGIPTLINAKDVRVKEMAELYNIPYIRNENIDSIEKLYELYIQTDYTDFNNKYIDLYNNFKNFLINNNIVDSPGVFSDYYELPDNIYQDLSSFPTESYFPDCYKAIKKFNILFKLINYIK